MVTNLKLNLNLQIRVAKLTPNRINPKRFMSERITMKLLKDKDKGKKT